MWVIFSVLIIAALAGLLELPTLLRKQLVAESWVFSSLLFIGTLLCILHFGRVKLPNPLDWITYVYHPVSQFVFGILK
ncbi:hypothetical protein [Paenibacillus aceris]|uniref:Ca2+/Na+ antiporter n=1 Tax=Paenibacillus aceris TaxID=869555 RepID=A0ABS4HXN3_9BACL|nr:hypothetical protein [Paenibacillus aceris]MBP1963422.1 Ca2+/Na+ antiporter [Paenibacillus aceris]NHW36692.1 hypothetical protein [Paenibacillus aceris]